EVAKGLGVELELVTTGFDLIESGAALDAGTCDIVASGITITEERQGQIDFSAPYCDARLGVRVPAASTIARVDDIDGQVAVQVGTTGKTYCEEIGLECLELEDLGLQVTSVESDASVAAINNSSVLLPFVAGNDNLKVAYDVETGEQYGLGVKK